MTCESTRLRAAEAPLDLDALEALAAACFAGPWRAETWSVDCECEDDCGEDHASETVTAPEAYPADPDSPQVIAQIDGVTGQISTPGLGQFASAHAAFIAAARTAVPALVAEVRRLRSASVNKQESKR